MNNKEAFKSKINNKFPRVFVVNKNKQVRGPMRLLLGVKLNGAAAVKAN